VSAKSGIGVEEAFCTLATAIVSRLEGDVTFRIINLGKPIPTYVPSHESVKRMAKPFRDYLQKHEIEQQEVKPPRSVGTKDGNCLLQ